MRTRRANQPLQDLQAIYVAKLHGKLPKYNACIIVCVLDQQGDVFHQTIHIHQRYIDPYIIYPCSWLLGYTICGSEGQCSIHATRGGPPVEITSSRGILI